MRRASRAPRIWTPPGTPSPYTPREFVDFAGCELLYAEPQDGDSDATIERVVWHMRDTIQSELGLPSSAGIGATRAVAKIASGLAKPAGVALVPVGEEERRFAPLPVRKIPGIGPVMESRLAAAGIETVGQLLGLRSGPRYARFAGTAASVRRALDPARGAVLGRDRPAFLEHDSQRDMAGSISNERTFSADIGDHDAVEGATGSTRWLEQRPAAPDSPARRDPERPPGDPDLE